ARATLTAAAAFTCGGNDHTGTRVPEGGSAPGSTLVLQGFVFSGIAQKNQYAGQPMSISVTAVDPSGRTVTGFSGPVRLKQITSYGDGRISPETVTLSGGSWSGSVTNYRVDETSH